MASKYGKGYFTVANEVHEYDGPTLTIVSPGYKHDETTEKFSTLFIVLFEFNSPELFKPFNTSKTTNIGLSLASSYQIMMAHDSWNFLKKCKMKNKKENPIIEK